MQPLCPCCSQLNYSSCCEPFIQREKFAQTPEALMRSRYAAFTLADVDYIRQTMRGKAAKNFDPQHILETAEKTHWLGLRVVRSSMAGDIGEVEFVARYEFEGKEYRIHECSQFLREDGRWFYVDGEPVKVGRNDDCPCGSGRKYKKCCLKS